MKRGIKCDLEEHHEKVSEKEGSSQKHKEVRKKKNVVRTSFRSVPILLRSRVSRDSSIRPEKKGCVSDEQNRVLESKFICDTLCSEEPKLGDPNLYPVLAGRFKVFKFLGGGGDGNVFSAKDKHRSMSAVALKVLKYKYKADYLPLSDLEVLKGLQDLEEFSRSHIVTMNEHFFYLDHIFMSFELLGPSLHQVLELNENTGFSISEVRDILFQILTAACFLHNNGIIHTDIKPGNIVFVNEKFTEIKTSPGKFKTVMKDINVRLIDLEQAISSETGRISFRNTICTEQYRSPELILRLDFDNKCDLWSIGCTAYDLFFNRNLFYPDQGVLKHLCVIEAVIGKQIPLEMSKKSPLKLFNRKGKLKYTLNATELRKVMLHYVKLNLHTYNCAGNENEDYFHKLLNRFLEIDPKLRISANEALQNPWFNSSSAAIK